jgi:Undecaprenyl-phosphate galactose phosphotransferase WbaP
VAVASCSTPRVNVTARPAMCGLFCFLGDLAAIMCAAAIAVGARYFSHDDIHLSLYIRMAPAVLIFAGVYAFQGLYPGITLSPVREIRQLTLSTTLVFAIFTALLFLAKQAGEFSRIAFLVAWVLTLFFVPLTRALLRTVLGRRSWWGYPVVVFGARGSAHHVVEDLRLHPHVGLVPVAAFDDRPFPATENETYIPFLGGFAEAAAFAQREGLSRALIAIPDLDNNRLEEILDSQTFSRFYIFPEISGLSSLLVEPRELCNRVTLEVKRSLLLPECQLAKRCMDSLLGLILSLVFAPLMILIAILIRLESRGPALFTQRRMGLGGTVFEVWKFRTMYQDADRILEEHFKKHPEDQVEWERVYKLRHDPRVTPLGRILRRTSLDELPQLWNVLSGNMSLVGPRPIPTYEVAKYGKSFGMYCRVIPGLTGLWQVSGRSETNYQQRIEFDTYYVRNWSPWFDIYLLMRTFLVVVKGEGAY